MTSRNVAGSHDRCYPRVLVQLGTSVAVPDRGDPVARTGELEASARDLVAVVELPRRSQESGRGWAGRPPPQVLRDAGQPLQDHRSPTSNRAAAPPSAKGGVHAEPAARVDPVDLDRPVCRLHDRSRAKGESPSQWQRLIGFTISPASCLCSAGSSVNCVAPLPLVPSITGLEVARAVLGRPLCWPTDSA